VDAVTGIERWTAHYDRPLKDIFAVQDEIVGKVVTTLGLLIKVDEMKLPGLGSAQPTENLEAYDDLLRAADYTWRRANKDDNAKARPLLEKAIALDPDYAEAYAALGWFYMTAVWNQWSDNPRADLERATELGQKALALDDTNSDALTLMCESDWMHSHYDQAVADGERAVTITPNYATGYQALADTLIIYGKPEAAISAAQKALRLDPGGKNLHLMSVGIAYVLMGRYEDAVPILKESVTAYPNIMVTHISLIQAYVGLGREEDARAAAAEIMRMSPQFTVASVPHVRDAAWNIAGA
jgi:adenylate cyclase